MEHRWSGACFIEDEDDAAGFCTCGTEVNAKTLDEVLRLLIDHGTVIKIKETR